MTACTLQCTLTPKRPQHLTIQTHWTFWTPHTFQQQNRNHEWNLPLSFHRQRPAARSLAANATPVRFRLSIHSCTYRMYLCCVHKHKRRSHYIVYTINISRAPASCDWLQFYFSRAPSATRPGKRGPGGAVFAAFPTLFRTLVNNKVSLSATGRAPCAISELCVCFRVFVSENAGKSSVSLCRCHCCAAISYEKSIVFFHFRKNRFLLRK